MIQVGFVLPLPSNKCGKYLFPHLQSFAPILLVLLLSRFLEGFVCLVDVCGGRLFVWFGFVLFRFVRVQ